MLLKGIRAMHEEDDGSSSDSSGYLHTILQLGSKFLITVKIYSVPVEMEVNSGAERSTVPLVTFNQ